MDKLRRVEINGHQEYWQGWFHKFTDSGLAIIESDGGGVSLIEVHKITFLDKPNPPNK